MDFRIGYNIIAVAYLLMALFAGFVAGENLIAIGFIILSNTTLCLSGLADVAKKLDRLKE